MVGYIKGKSAIHIARRDAENGRYFEGQRFWVSGYFVSTVGRDKKNSGTTHATKEEMLDESSSSIWFRVAPFRGRKEPRSGSVKPL